MRACRVAVTKYVRARATLAAVAALAILGSAGCTASSDDSAAVVPDVAEPTDDSMEDMLDPCSRANLTTVEPGALTFVTPAAPAPPYFLTDQPADQQGLESVFAYALAEQLGFRSAEVTWEIVDATQILGGEFVDYDVAIGGFTDRGERFPAIEYSQPYFQSRVDVVVESDRVRAALVGTGDANGPRVEDLRWAAEIQGPGPEWLVERGWLAAAEVDVTFRGAEQADAAAASTDVRLIDEPTLTWLTEVVGRGAQPLAYADAPTAEYVLAMVAGNPLAACVDRALGEMSTDGRIVDLVDEWLDTRNWEQ